MPGRGLKPIQSMVFGVLIKCNPLYKWQYIRQIKWNIYETFRTTYWGCPKMIQHSKVDPIILNSSQNPSTSSKYDHIFDALLIMLRNQKLAYNLIMAYYGYLWCKIWYQRWPNLSKLQSGTINIFQIWPCSWCTSNHTRKLKIDIKVKNDIQCWFMM